jgi:hypothetical protein
MSHISRYLINGAPTRCRFCGNQFPIKNGHLEAWYNGQGAYFCNEYCASEEGRHDRCEGSSGACMVEAARWHCVRYVMAITKKRFSLPNCAKRTAHS